MEVNAFPFRWPIRAAVDYLFDATNDAPGEMLTQPTAM